MTYFKIDITGVDENKLQPGDLWGIDNYLNGYPRTSLGLKARTKTTLVQDQIHSSGTTTPKIRIDIDAELTEQQMRTLSVNAVFYVCMYRLNIPLRYFTIESEHIVD